MKSKSKGFKWFVIIMILLILSVLLTFAGGIISAVWENGITLYIAAGMAIITLIVSIIGLAIIYHEMEGKVD